MLTLKSLTKKIGYLNSSQDKSRMLPFSLKQLFLILLLFSVHPIIFSQNSEKIFSINQIKRNKITFRIFPADYKTWKLGNTYGYKIERVITTKGTKPDTTLFTKGATVLTSSPLLPLSAKDERWNNLENQYETAGLVHQDIMSAPVTHSTEDEEQSMWTLLMVTIGTAADISKAAGTTFTDTTINNNTVYAYKISLTKNKTTQNIKPQIIIIDASKLNQTPPPPDSLKIKFGNRFAIIKWKHIATTSDYDSYIIERSTDSINFSRINKAPFVFAYTKDEKNKTEMLYKDSIPKNDTTFYYRVIGVTSFGEPGTPSKIVKGTGRLDFDIAPFLDKAKNIENKKMQLQWHLPEGFLHKLLKGFTVSRAQIHDGPYTNITFGMLLPLQFKYEDVQPQKINYYRVGAISIYGDTIYSLPVFAQLYDLTPPAMPTGLAGQADSNGVVTITWKANTENDLMGYRVFRANNPNEEFVEATKKILTQPFFTDTLVVRTLAKNIYYEVTAVDIVYNNSNYSNPIKIKRPDKIPPVKPLFTTITQNSRGILLNWVTSSSDDVINYELTRKVIATNATTILKIWQPADSIISFMDTIVSNNNKYIYTLHVHDDSNNESQQSSHTIEYVSGIPPIISNIKSKVDREQQSIELLWNYPQSGIDRFIIYKAKKGDALRIYKTLPAQVSLFKDKDSKIGNTYIYKIKAVFKNGTESPMSNNLEIIY